MALLVARVLANDAHDTLPADDAAGFTKLFDGRTDFHGRKEGNGVCSSHTRRLPREKGTVRRQKHRHETMKVAGRGAIRSIPTLLGKCRNQDFLFLFRSVRESDQ